MDTYGLVGYPLTQSFSQKYFTEKFQNENIPAQYVNFSLESIGEFPEIIQNPDLKGLNVTIPYKEKVMPFVHELDEEAKKVGAINVIKIQHEKEKLLLTGYNSDIYGFETSLSKYLKAHHSRALILGTGGASKAVRYVCKKLGIEFTLVSRKPKKGWLSYPEITSDRLREFPLVINTTPLGMYPHVSGFPTLPYEAASDKHLAFDLIYNPAETVFMQKFKAQGAFAVNGYEMLLSQAEKAWEIWNR